jgi:hypothetical protein
MNEKTKKRIIALAIILGMIYLYLLILNGRYVATGDFAFDQWTGKYVDDCWANIKKEGIIYRLFNR